MDSKHDLAFGIIPICIKPNGHTYLLIHHVKGHWGFPKGHPIEKEKPLDTARRELLEETGLKNISIISSSSFYDEYTYLFGNQKVRKKITYWIGKVSDEHPIRIQKKEIQNYFWCSFEKAYEYISFKEGKQLISKIENYVLLLEKTQKA